MTDIDAPLWVVDKALDAWDELSGHPSEEHRMRAALRSALSAWVVPGPYRFLKNGDNPSDWLDRGINGEPPNPKHLREEFSIQNAYTLRQEKPE